MHSLTRLVTLVTVGALAACGGGSGSTPSVTPVVKATAAAQAGATATAKVTIKFPKTAQAHKKGAAIARKPTYVNPNGQSIVVSVNGQAVGDPSNNNKLYFSLSNTNTDGSVNISVPIVPGNYPDGSVVFTEYANADGTGAVLAFGYNAPYQDTTTGSSLDGAANISAGATASLLVTMAMNVANLAITSDPTGASGATLLDPSDPTASSYCTSSGNLLYIVPTDALGTYVVPGQSGYLGADSSNGVPGLTQITLTNLDPQGGTLVSAFSGGSAYVFGSRSSGYVNAYFSATNPLANIPYYYPSPTAFGVQPYSSTITGASAIGNGCG